MNKLLLLVTFIIRVGSGIVMLMQGYEKLTGGFTLKGLVPVIANNTDSPEWYKLFFANIVAHTTSLFDIVVPLGEIAIGLGLIFGVFAYAASFFGAFVMINYIFSRYDIYVSSSINFLYPFTNESLIVKTDFTLKKSLKLF